MFEPSISIIVIGLLVTAFLMTVNWALWSSSDKRIAQGNRGVGLATGTPTHPDGGFRHAA
ncbi:MAG TPA: hypothetical protein VFB15_06980 [Candidatus Binataceae bacterium]|nr:hypothetical protein [Candidatus Binataceae bacterium]